MKEIKKDFLNPKRIRKVLFGMLGVTFGLVSLMYVEYSFFSEYDDSEEYKRPTSSFINLDLGESINLSSYINTDDIKYLSFKNETVYSVDEEYNVQSLSEGEDELKVLYNDNTDDTLYFNTEVVTSNAEIDNHKRLVMGSITLNNNKADSNKGASRIYYKYYDYQGKIYDLTYYRDSEYKNQMTPTTYRINTPSRNGYTFAGYYYVKNNNKIKIINEEGYINKNVVYNGNKLYALWIKNNVRNYNN